MHQVVDFLTGLFDTSKWPPRWHCGQWTSFHGWLFIISDLLIWLAYFLMPVIILRYFRNKKDVIKFSNVYILFALFILLCGATHFIDAMMFWVPMYRFNALVRLATAVVSMLTVYQLFKILPIAFKQKTNIELEREIERRREAERRLGEANANLEAFAYIASHDLQEPLRKIRMYSSMLDGDDVPGFSDDKREIRDKITSSASRMQTMIQDVLTLSTISVNTNFTTVQTAEAVRIAISDLELKIRERRAVIHVGELPAVTGNKEYLAQLFLNLIGNAIKFSKEEPMVAITGAVKGDKVVIAIKDNGIGMDEADRSKIFYAFQRLHSRAEYEGSGIGLAIVKRIVDLHNGQISLTSKKAEGTTFIVELPKA